MKSITVEAKIENVDKVTEFVNEVLEEKDCPLKVHGFSCGFECGTLSSCCSQIVP